jgi:tRNA G26 N,N-dimethylase Trm1
MCHTVGTNGISVHVFKAALQQLGFEVGTSHTNPQGIKSNAPPSVSHPNYFEFELLPFTAKL